MHKLVEDYQVVDEAQLEEMIQLKGELKESSRQEIKNKRQEATAMTFGWYWCE